VVEQAPWGSTPLGMRMGCGGARTLGIEWVVGEQRTLWRATSTPEKNIKPLKGEPDARRSRTKLLVLAWDAGSDGRIRRRLSSMNA